ncbi:MAG: hypothetical protein ABIG28_03325 [archaeon]
MRKRGISHVEMVLSFVIFAAAVGFALYFFNPLDSGRLVESSLIYGFREISENVTIDLETFSVIVENAKIEEDYNPNINPLPPVLVIDFGADLSELGLKTRVKTGGGEDLDSLVSMSAARISLGNNWKEVNLINIWISEEFEDDSPNEGKAYREDYYEVASREIEEVISEARFLNLRDFYYSNYLKMKKDFNIPNRVNIGFSLALSDGAFIVAEQEIPRGLNVFSETKRVKVLRAESKESEFGDLTISVW